MRYKFFLFVLLFLLASCSPDVPATSVVATSVVVEKNESTVDAVERFINKRYIIIYKFIDEFVVYSQSIMSKKDISKDVFYTELPPAILSEKKKSTKKIVKEFVASAKGAYLSEQDKEYIKRLLKEKKELIKVKVKSVKSALKEYNKTDGDPEYSFRMIDGFYSYTPEATAYIKTISLDMIDKITNEIKTKMLNNNMKVLWGKYENLDGKDFFNSSVSKLNKFDNIVIGAIKSNISYSDKSHKSFENEKIENVIGSILFQGFTSSIFERSLKTLSYSGVNAYIGSNGIKELSLKIKDSIIKLSDVNKLQGKE